MLCQMPLFKSIFQTGKSEKYWLKNTVSNDSEELPILSGNMMIYSKKKFCTVSKKFILQGSRLIYQNNKGIKKERDIEHDIFTINNNWNESKPSFSLSYPPYQKTFICSNNKDFNKWCENIKQQCLNISFTEDFTILNEISKGSTAKVYKIQSNNKKKLYACKIFPKKESKLKETINYEIRVMRHLSNDKIPKLDYVYEDENQVYLIMDLINGLTIRDYLILYDKFDEAKAKEIVKNVLKALEYLETRKIIHRDIKPGNIMILDQKKDDNTSIKLIDFGFSTGSEFIDTSYVCGTPGYIAPEIFEFELFDYKVDIFSLGIVLYVMLTGQRPFSGVTQQIILQLNMEASINYDQKVWATISQSAQDLIKRMTAKDPNDRISCQEALESPWFKDDVYYPIFGASDEYDDIESVLSMKIEHKMKTKYFYSNPTKIGGSKIDTDAFEDYLPLWKYMSKELDTANTQTKSAEKIETLQWQKINQRQQCVVCIEFNFQNEYIFTESNMNKQWYRYNLELEFYQKNRCMLIYKHYYNLE